MDRAGAVGNDVWDDGRYEGFYAAGETGREDGICGRHARELFDGCLPLPYTDRTLVGAEPALIQVDPRIEVSSWT